jgi:SpoVK/Ycf46/Vps4 family AAA+-type ATPase
MLNRLFVQNKSDLNPEIFWKDYFLTMTRLSATAMEGRIGEAKDKLIRDGRAGEDQLYAVVSRGSIMFDGYQETLEKVRGTAPTIPLSADAIVGSGRSMLTGSLGLGLIGSALEIVSGEAIFHGFLLSGTSVGIGVAIVTILTGAIGSAYAKEYESTLKGIQTHLQANDFKSAQKLLEAEMYNRWAPVRATRSLYLEKMHYALAHFFAGIIAEYRAFEGRDSKFSKASLNKAFAEYTAAENDAIAAGLKANDLLLIIRMQHMRLVQKMIISDYKYNFSLVYRLNLTMQEKQDIKIRLTKQIDILEKNCIGTLNQLASRHIILMLAQRRILCARQLNFSFFNFDSLIDLLKASCQFIFTNTKTSALNRFTALASVFFRAKVFAYLGHVFDDKVKILPALYCANYLEIPNLADDSLLSERSLDQDTNVIRISAAAELMIHLLREIENFKKLYPQESKSDDIKNALEYMSDFVTAFALAHSHLAEFKFRRSVRAAFEMVSNSDYLRQLYTNHKTISYLRIAEINSMRKKYQIDMNSYESFMDALIEPGQPNFTRLIGAPNEAMLTEIEKFPDDTMPDGMTVVEASSIFKEYILSERRRALIVELKKDHLIICKTNETILLSDMDEVLSTVFKIISSGSYTPILPASSGKTLLHWLASFGVKYASPNKVKQLAENLIEHCEVFDFQPNTVEMMLRQSRDPYKLLPIIEKYNIWLKQRALRKELENDFGYFCDEDITFNDLILNIIRDIKSQKHIVLQSPRTGRTLLHWLATFDIGYADTTIIALLVKELMSCRYLRDLENNTAESLLTESKDICKLLPIFNSLKTQSQNPLMLKVDDFIDNIRKGGDGGEHFMLLSGPPGTGKTTTITEYLRTHHSDDVQVHEWTRGSESDRWVGQIDARLEKFFTDAIEETEISSKVQILFVDEIDTICKEARDDDSNDRQTGQLFQIKTSSLRGTRVALMGATNYPNKVAKAMLSRASGNHLTFQLPTRVERLSLLQHQLRNSKVLPGFFEKMAVASHGWSHRQLADACVHLRKAKDIDLDVIGAAFAVVARQFESVFAAENPGATLFLPPIQMKDSSQFFINITGVDKCLVNTIIELSTWLHSPISFDNSPRRHVLLHGKPGGGKTYAISKLLENTNVPFIRVDKVLNADKFASLFDYAGQFDHAVIFIDEIDAIFSYPFVAECLQTNMDGMKHSGVTVMAATNYPRALPEAIFDRFTSMIKVSPMNKEQKQAFIYETIKSALQSTSLIVEKELQQELDGGCPSFLAAAADLSLRSLLSVLRIAIENRCLSVKGKENASMSKDMILRDINYAVASRKAALFDEAESNQNPQALSQRIFGARGR